MLDEAEPILGRNLLAAERKRLTGGELPASVVKGNPSAFEHYWAGRMLLRRVERRMGGSLRRGGTAATGRLLALLYHGICANALADLRELGTAFRVCLALMPRSAEAHVNHAIAQAALDRREVRWQVWIGPWSSSLDWDRPGSSAACSTPG